MKQKLITVGIYVVAGILTLIVTPFYAVFVSAIGIGMFTISINEELVRILTVLAITIAVCSVLYSASRSVTIEAERTFLSEQGKNLLGCILLLSFNLIIKYILLNVYNLDKLETLMKKPATDFSDPDQIIFFALIMISAFLYVFLFRRIMIAFYKLTKYVFFNRY